MLTRASRLSKEIQRKIFNSFADDRTAVQATIDIGRDFFDKDPEEWIIGTDGKYVPSWHASFHITTLRHFKHFREKIVAHQLAQYPRLGGHIEIDITEFGGYRRRQSAERRATLKAAGKIKDPVRSRRSKVKKHFDRKVLGIMERGGQIVLIPIDTKRRRETELLIQQIVEKGSVIYTDAAPELAELKLLGYTHHVLNKARDGYKNKKGWHVSTIEAAFRQIHEKMDLFRGIPPSTIDFHIKEREFRYNHRKDLTSALRAVIFGK